MYTAKEIKEILQERGYGVVIQYLHPGTWEVEDEVHTSDVGFIYEAQFNPNAWVCLD